jgi:FixJ family two-component response regulator
MGMEDLCLPLGDGPNALKRGTIQEPTVFIINGYKEERDSLHQIVASVGWVSKSYSSAESFLDEFNPAQPGCLLLDAEVPEMGGLLLQKELRSRNNLLPILFTSSKGTVQDAVQALRRGAVDFLMKPLKKPILLRRLGQCIEKNRDDWKVQREWERFTTKLKHLTPREHEVMKLMVKGRLSKVIAFDLDISIKTVEIHRAQVMRKLRVKNQAELIQLSLFFSSKGGAQLSSLR